MIIDSTDGVFHQSGIEDEGEVGGGRVVDDGRFERLRGSLIAIGGVAHQLTHQRLLRPTVHLVAALHHI